MSEDKKELRDPLGEGHEPLEIAGPQDSGATAIQAEFRPGELDGAPQEAQYQSADEVADAFVEEPIAMIPSPEDGLPVPAEESSKPATAPPYNYDTVVCIEDDRSFVSIFLGEEDFDADVFHWRKGGTAKRGEVFEVTDKVSQGYFRLFLPWRYYPDGAANDRHTARPDRVVKKFDHLLVVMTAEELLASGISAPDDTGTLTYMLVRPVRPVCQHYRSQVFSNDDEPDPLRPGHRIVFSNCMARRSVGGAMMSLRDEGVYACEHRSPPDPASTDRYLTQWNKDRLAKARHVVQVPLFNLPPVTHRHAAAGVEAPAAPKPPKDKTP